VLAFPTLLLLYFDSAVVVPCLHDSIGFADLSLPRLWLTATDLRLPVALAVAQNERHCYSPPVTAEEFNDLYYTALFSGKGLEWNYTTEHLSVTWLHHLKVSNVLFTRSLIL
jgi:hypothetical protein